MDLSGVDNEIKQLIYDANQLSASAAQGKSKGLIGAIKGIFINNEEKYNDANNLYTQAINSLKMTPDKIKRWDLIVLLKLRRIENFARIDSSSHELQVEHREVAKIYVDKLENYKKGLFHYLEAVKYCTYENNMKRVQDYMKEMAEIYDKKMMDYQTAIEYYEKAIEADDNSQVYKIYIEIANIHCKLNHFEQAVVNFENAGKICMDNSMLKWSAREIYTMATLCGICLSGENFYEKYTEYKNLVSTFNNTIENSLIEKIFEAYEKNSAEIFHDAILEYDRLTGQLSGNSPKINLLTHIKNNINIQDELM